MRKIVLLAVLALSAGCRSSLLGLDVDGGTDGPVDLATPPTGDLATLCDHHRLLPRAVTEMRLLNPGQLDPGQQAIGSVIRVLLNVPLRPCEALGPVEVRFMPGNATDFAVITAYVWTSAVDCGPTAPAFRVAYITQDLGQSNQMMVIGDGAPNPTFQPFRVPVGPMPMGATCMSSVPVNAVCQLDCQCRNADPRTRCILDSPSSGRCAIPCEADSDCPAGQSLHCDTGFDYTCRVSQQKMCGTCLFGQACLVDACRPTDAPAGGPCSCDRDCAPGRLCSLAGFCVAPCTTDNDCPAGRPRCQQGACSP